MKNLKQLILTEPGGARFPSILSLQYYGAPTATAILLGLVGNDGNLVPGAPQPRCEKSFAQRASSMTTQRPKVHAESRAPQPPSGRPARTSKI